MAGKLKQLQDRGVALSKALRELADKVAAEDDRAFSEDEQKEFDALTEEAETVVEATKREQGIQKLLKDLIPTGSTAGSDGASTGSGAIRIDDTSGVTVTEAWEKDPKRGFASPAEFLTCVLNQERSGRSEVTDPRLRFQAASVRTSSPRSLTPTVGFCCRRGSHRLSCLCPLKRTRLPAGPQVCRWKRPSSRSRLGWTKTTRRVCRGGCGSTGVLRAIA